eukprot:364976-Chlamydomonas_euryale.AAC.7
MCEGCQPSRRVITPPQRVGVVIKTAGQKRRELSAPLLERKACGARILDSTGRKQRRTSTRSPREGARVCRSTESPSEG